MTDLEEFRALLKKWEVPWSEGSTSGTGITIGPDEWGDRPPSPKVEGYRGFYAEFVFGDDGEFQGVGIWE